jgi:hypothetical protein
MGFRIAGTALRSWRDRIEGRLAVDTNQSAVRAIFTLWLAAFLLKHSGSAWDVSWHFRYVFGALEPPHWLNIFGTALAAVLFWLQINTGKAVERTGFLVMQIAFVVFLVHMPLDVLNHYLFGLDVTLWSPTHMLGFAASALMMAGLLYSWLRLATPGRWRLVVALICWAYLLDAAIFMLGQQEYGVIALDAYARGLTTASPELLAQAGRNPGQFVRGGIPGWLYPVWMILTATLVQLAARRITGWRWAATAATLLYLAFRVVGRLLLGAFGFPISFVPVMLLPGALAIDIAESRHWPPLALAAALAGAYYSSAALIDRYTLMPEFPISAAPFVFAALWGGLEAARWWRQGQHDRPTPGKERQNYSR